MMSSGEQLPRSEWPTVTEFYSGHDIFITGATGFMGKCLVEKVLRSLPTAGHVFVMVRPKKGKSVKERMEELTNLKVSSEINALLMFPVYLTSVYAVIPASMY